MKTWNSKFHNFKPFVDLLMSVPKQNMFWRWTSFLLGSVKHNCKQTHTVRINVNACLKDQVILCASVCYVFLVPFWLSCWARFSWWSQPSAASSCRSFCTPYLPPKPTEWSISVNQAIYIWVKPDTSQH